LAGKPNSFLILSTISENGFETSASTRTVFRLGLYSSTLPAAKNIGAQKIFSCAKTHRAHFPAPEFDRRDSQCEILRLLQKVEQRDIDTRSRAARAFGTPGLQTASGEEAAFNAQSGPL